MAARAVGQRSPLAEATDRVNEQQLSTLAALVRARLDGGRRVTVLGADVTVVATPARAFRRVQVADL